jgi:hypothetical protein
VLTLVLVLGLLGGAAAAFAITEQLKLEKTPITSPEITKWYSWRSGRTALVQFRLRQPDRITVDIVQGGTVVANLATDAPHAKGVVWLHWDGRDRNGQHVPQGTYRARVFIEGADRTIVIPNSIRVALVPPKIRLSSVRPLVISPDHDGRAEYTQVRFHVNEPARIALVVDGHPAGPGRWEHGSGKLNWFGKLHGQVLGVGMHTLVLRAVDRAGNVARRRARVRIRYVSLPKVVHVGAGRPFHVRAGTDAKRVTWRLAGRTHRAAPPTLLLRAPRQPGRYTLYVTANGHSTAAAVVVRPAR